MTGDVVKVQALRRGVCSSVWRAGEGVPEEAHVEAGGCPHVGSNTLLTGDMSEKGIAQTAPSSPPLPPLQISC